MPYHCIPASPGSICGGLLRVLLVLAIAASQAAGDSAVLCICSDGHISLELVCDTNDCCLAELSQVESSSSGTDFAALPTAASDCTDIPLFGASDPALRQSNVDKSVAHGTAMADSACVPARLHYADELHATPGLTPLVFPSYSPSSQRRTIALLI